MAVRHAPLRGSGVRTAPSSPPEGPHTDRPRSRMRLQTVVVIEVILALGVLAWALSGSRLGWIALVVAGVIALALIPLPGRRSLVAWAGERLGFSWARSRRRSTDVAPAPFDIPVGNQTNAHASMRTASSTGHDTIGARWVDDTLITVLRVAAASPTATYLVPGSSSVADPHGQVVPLAALAECINPFDIALDSIEVISHGIRSWGAGPVSASYHRTLGPLSATAHRSVLVVLRLNPLDCADAVARRGGGSVGAIRTATITTRRVANRLSEHGLRVSILNGAEITAVTSQLAEGAPLDDLDEAWQSVEVHALRFRSAAIDPTALGEMLASVWVNPALSTTVTLRMRHDAAGELEVGAIARFAEVPTAGRAIDTWPTGLIPLDGHHFDALGASLPIAVSARLSRSLPVLRGIDAQEALRRLPLPASGCGQLVGADHTGRAVAVPLIGPDVREVAIAAGPQLVSQVILRAVAIGASVTIHSVRPVQWHHLIAAVADPQQLSMADDRIPPASGHRVTIFDGMAGPAAEPGTTHITVLAPGDPRIAEMVPDASVIVRQNPRTPQDFSVTTPNDRVAVTMVATPDEWTFIGR